MDISDTPDVAVWAKEIRRGASAPSDKVKEPSKNSSMMLRIVTKSATTTTTTTKTAEKEGGLVVDPANKKEMAEVSAAACATLTDESEYAKRE
ncbi:MAG TPA: hypothetical protein VHA09_04520 [Nitrososphaera sp.]|nr:hypothetical protein [Nitrososphaera sp.]